MSISYHCLVMRRMCILNSWYTKDGRNRGRVYVELYFNNQCCILTFQGENSIWNAKLWEHSPKMLSYTRRITYFLLILVQQPNFTKLGTIKNKSCRSSSTLEYPNVLSVFITRTFTFWIFLPTSSQLWICDGMIMFESVIFMTLYLHE